MVEIKLRLETRLTIAGLFLHKGKVYKMITREYATTDGGTDYIRVTADEVDVATLSYADKSMLADNYEDRLNYGSAPATMQ